MEARIKKLEEEVVWLRAGARKTAALSVSTDTVTDELRADKRLVLYVSHDMKTKTLKKYKEHTDTVAERKKQEEQKKEKADNDGGLMMDAEELVGDYKNWGDQLLVIMNEKALQILREKLEAKTENAVMLAKMESYLQSLMKLEGEKVIKYAFPHNKDPPADLAISWAWTLHFFPTDAATEARDLLLYYLAPLLKKTALGIGPDRPRAEGGRLRQEVRAHYNLPKPKARQKKNTDKDKNGGAAVKRAGQEEKQVAGQGSAAVASTANGTPIRIVKAGRGGGA